LRCSVGPKNGHLPAQRSRSTKTTGETLISFLANGIRGNKPPRNACPEKRYPFSS